MSVTAEFTRASIAYNEAGEVVRAKVPRFEDDGIMVEEGTTNLCSNPSVETNLDGWSASYRCSLARDDAYSKFGFYSAKLTTTDPADNFYCHLGESLTLSPSTVYTFNAYVKSAISVKLETVEYLTPSGYAQSYSAWSTGLGEWERISVTFTTNADIDHFETRLRGPGSCSIGEIVYIDGVCVEESPSPTTFIDETRAAEKVIIPNPSSIMSFNQGTISGHFTPSENFFEGSWNRIVGHNSTATNKDELQLMRNSKSNTLSFAISNNSNDPAGGSWTYCVSATEVVTGATYHWAIRWDFDAELMSLWINGVKESEKALSSIYKPSVWGTLAIGYHPDTDRWANSCFRDTRFDNIALSSTQITADASADKLERLSSTTALIDFTDKTLRDKTSGFSVTNDSPSAGSIAWADLDIQYKGISYNIADGDTANTFAYWDYDDPYVLQETDVLPSLAADDVLAFYNKSGTSLVVPTATVVDGGLIVSGSIIANALASNSVTADKIAANAVTADKIIANAISTDKIAANAVGAAAIAAGVIVADHIAANQITADKMDISDLSAISANLGTVNAGTVNADVVIAGTYASVLETNAANGAIAYTGTATYRTAGAPSSNPSPVGIDKEMTSNGSLDIKLSWDSYTQGAKQADQILLFWKKGVNSGLGASTLNDNCVSFNVNTTGASYYTFEGVAPEKYYSFGIAAARRTENGLEIGAIQSPTSTPDWQDVTEGSPDFTGDINESAGVATKTAGGISDALDGYGTGSDGAFNSTGNVTWTVATEDSSTIVKQFTSFTLNEGHTLTVDKRCRGVIVYVRGNVVINGTVNLQGKSAKVSKDETIQRTLQVPLGAVVFEVPPGGSGGDGGDGGDGGGDSSPLAGVGGNGTTGTEGNWFGGGWGAPGAGGGGGVPDDDATGIGGWNGGDAGSADLDIAIGDGGTGTSLAEGGIGGNFSGGGGGSGNFKNGSQGGGGGGGAGINGGIGGPAPEAYGDPGENGDSVDSAGGCMFLACVKNDIIIGAAGVVNCNGSDSGDGGDGGNNSWNDGGGGGGGGGQGSGGGGTAILAYGGSYTNSGSVTVNAGTPGNGGLGGTAYHNGSVGTNGTAGSAGTITTIAL